MPASRLGDRAGFPRLAARSYLAHCAISPVSDAVQAAVDAVMDAYARDGVRTVGRWLAQRNELRAALARLIGAGSDDIGLVASTTLGVIDVAHAIPWRAGDRVVVFAGEFPTNVTPWRQAAATFGLQVETLPLTGFGLPGDPDGDGLARLEATLRRGARLVAVSGVQFQTGLAMPLAEMARLCHAHGAELFVDAIQAVGVVPLDVAALGVDYLACGSHKWLMGTEGCGFVYVAPSRAPALVPRLAGWLSHEDPVGFLFGGPVDYDRPFRARADVFEVGAANVAGFAALGAAIAPLAEIGVDAIFGHVQAWHDAIEPRLVDRGFRSLRSLRDDRRSGILSVRPPPGVDPQALVAALGTRGVTVSAPEGCVRLAPHWPNALDEVDVVTETVDAALAAVR